jgi:hypothetical protein
VSNRNGEHSTALSDLIRESVSRENLLEGDLLVDGQVYRVRITMLLGLMALHSIVCRIRAVRNEFDAEMSRFIKTHGRELHLWGESAVPYLVLFGLYLEGNEGARSAEQLWGTVLGMVVARNKPRRDKAGDTALADPYLGIEDSLAQGMGVDRGLEWDKPDYEGQAYTLRALVMMLARRWRRQLLSS